MHEKWESMISEALSKRGLIRIGRHNLEPQNIFSEGYLVGVSKKFLLLHKIGERIDLDGYEIIRLSDVTSLTQDFPRKAFIEKAINIKSLAPDIPEGIDLSDLRNLLRSIEQAFPLIVIERERTVPGECEIGRLKVITDESYSLKPISVDGAWGTDLQVYKLKDITRISFGGHYENTLALVASLAEG